MLRLSLTTLRHFRSLSISGLRDSECTYYNFWGAPILFWCKLQWVISQCVQVDYVSALVAEWKSHTGASCNWWQPPPVQVECLHQLKEGKHESYAGRFQKATAGKRTGPITKWPPRRLLFTRLIIVFVAISPFTKRTKVVPKVFQEGECCLEGLINLACGLQLQMLPRLNGHFMNVLVWFCM